ncbi:extended synaptotagmin-3-like [Stylophora pistillata]|nr:extended synaptotagmin-3-like [Stylophora pistillata]
MEQQQDKNTASQMFQAFVGIDRRQIIIHFLVASMLWLFGWWNISFAWVIMFVLIYVFGEYRSEVSKRKRKNFRKMTDEANLSKIKSFPIPSVYLSETESSTWLNEFIKKLWPSIEGMTKNIIKERVEPEIQKNLPSAFKTLSFDKIELGQKPPFVGNIKSYASGNGEKRASEFIMDADVTYNGDAQVKVTVKNVNLGISDFQIYGSLRIILKPLLSNQSIVGGVTLFFLKRPRITFNLTNLLNVLDFPGLKKTLRGIVDDVIASFAVLPNRIAIPLAESVDLSDLQYPIPEGLLRVQILGARELVKSDFSLIGGASPDPYAILEVGAQKFRTETKKNASNPGWEETFESFVDNSMGQELEIYLYDRDVASKDSKIGSVDIKIRSVVEEGVQDIWLPLEKAKQGKIHLNLEWFSLSCDPLHFRYTREKETVAVLFVKLIKAQNLPSSSSSVVTRKVFCKVSVGDIALNSFFAHGDEMVWGQSLRFLLTDPHEEARIEVMEGNDNKSLGSMLFVIRKLIEEPEMARQDSFRLNGGTGSLECKFILRALKTADTSNAPMPLQFGRKFNAFHNNGICLQRVDTPTMLPDVNAQDDPSTSASTESDSSRTAEKTSSSSSGSSSGSSPSGSIAGDTSNGQSPEASVRDYMSRGEVSLWLIYDHRRNRLVVTVLSAKELVSSEPVSKTNPYIQLNLLPSRSKRSIRKTDSYAGSLNPVFNDTFEYVIGLDQLCNKYLEVIVKNERFVQLPGKSRDLIGSTSINLCELSLSAGVTMNCELTK